MANISKLRSIISNDKGMSYANEYEVSINFKDGPLKTGLANLGFNQNGAALANMLFLCDEANLPSQFASTQEFDGLYTGRLIQYGTSKLYNDFSLSFMLTNKMNPTKFFDAWMYFMFPEHGADSGKRISVKDYQNRRLRNNITTVNYYDDYVCDFIQVKKVYKTKDDPSGGTSITYKMYNAYPFTIESVPLAYGASTLAKLRVNFKYEKYIVER